MGNRKTKCPKCKIGGLVVKEGKFGAFLGCTQYPDCDYRQKIVPWVSASSVGEAKFCPQALFLKTKQSKKRSAYRFAEQMRYGREMHDYVSSSRFGNFSIHMFFKDLFDKIKQWLGMKPWR